MKYFFWLMCLTFTLTVSLGTAQAQDEDYLEIEEKVLNKDHDRIIKLRPLDLGQISIAYEKFRSARVSNELGLSYVYHAYLDNDSPFELDRVDVSGIHVTMTQRHYTSKKSMAPFGFYHGPMFGYRFLAFEKNVLKQKNDSPPDPNYQFIGRLYQNSLDLGYQIGGQFQLGKHFTTEVGFGMGARVKYARAVGAKELLTENIIGHVVVAERNTAVFAMPLPQLNFSVGYSF